ncbi:MAG TPA: sigma-70 family RNA polymerase sigma factor [Cyclobacteriaceae bacterium]|nr:sigma-70 family RNA polymerase sigma factor [Cyclobacteriaceae bacterium]
MEGQSDTLFGRSLESLLSPEPILFTSKTGEADRDLKIWNAFRAGSREALDYIFKQHVSNLFAYGSKFTKDQDLVLDCIQDLFVELWNRRQSLSETNSIRFYLLRALRRRIARTIHGVKRFEAITEEAQYLEEKINFSAEHFLVVQETEQARIARLKRAIEELTKRQRESIYLKFFQGLDNKAVATVMGLSEASVSTLVSQAIRALRVAFS